MIGIEDDVTMHENEVCIYIYIYKKWSQKMSQHLSEINTQFFKDITLLYF